MTSRRSARLPLAVACATIIAVVAGATPAQALDLGPLTTMSASPNPAQFGSVSVGSTPELTITVKNTSLLPALPSVAIQGGRAFSLVPGADKCSGQIVLPTLTCTVGATFAPVETGIDNGNLVISGDFPTVSVSLSGTATSIYDWSMYHGGASHTGQTAAAMPAASAGPQWSYSQPGDNTFGSSPAVGPDGTIYMLQGANTLLGGLQLEAISPTTHQPIWSWNDPTAGTVATKTTPAVAPGGTVYVNATGGAPGDVGVIALGPGGVVRWRLTNFSPVGSPTIGSDGTVYVADTSSSVHAIDPTTGSVMWSYTDPAPSSFGSNGTPSLSPVGDTLYTTSGAHLLALTGGRQGGRLLWSYAPATAGFVGSTAVVGSDGTVYLTVLAPNGAGTPAHLEAINPNGTLEWSYAFSGGSTGATPAVTSDGRVIAGDGTAIDAIDQATGKLEWAFQPPSTSCSGFGSPTVSAEGNTYVENQCSMFAVSKSGSLLWSADASASGANPAPDGTGHVLLESSTSLFKY